MRTFWTMFFLGSLLLVGLDVAVAQQGDSVQPGYGISASADPLGAPTPW